MIPRICFKISWFGNMAGVWIKQNSLGVDLYGSWLMSGENPPYYSVCFCVHEKQLTGIYTGGFRLQAVWRHYVSGSHLGRECFHVQMQTPELISSSTQRKTFWAWYPGMICTFNRLPWWVLPSLKPKKHWLKLSDYLLKINSHFWINLFYKFRFLNINFLPANLNF